MTMISFDKMDHNAKLEHFSRLEHLLVQLLERVSLPQNTHAEVQKFINAAEYGLAFEWIIDSYHAANQRMPEITHDIVEQLAALMNMDKDERLRDYIKTS